MSTGATHELGTLTREVAGFLGNGWRPGVYAYESGQVPVIRTKDQMLIFSASPEDPDNLRVSLFTEREHLWLDIPPNLGIGETTTAIRQQLLAVAHANAREARERENARGIQWHNDWCRLFTEFADRGALSVRFTADTNRGAIVGLHAAFHDFDLYQPVCTVTVTPGAFPVRIEYFTEPETVRALITGHKAAVPAKRRRLGRRAA